MSAEPIYSTSACGSSPFSCYDIAHVSLRMEALTAMATGNDHAIFLQQSDEDFETILDSEIKRRRDRDKIVGLPQDSDPAWNIMLDLLKAHFRKSRISVSSACIASKAPATTALRYLALLEKNGLVVRQPDSTDGRRQFIILSELGLALMRKYLLAAQSH